MLAAVKSFGRSAFGVVSAGAADDFDIAQQEPGPIAAPRPVILWVPLAMVAGIWTYFALPIEPQAWSAWVILLLSVVMLWRARLRGSGVLLAMALAGFGLAKLRTDMVATPLITARTGEVLVIGTLQQKLQRSTKRAELVIAAEQIETLVSENRPRRLRLTLYGDSKLLSPGERVSFKARLWPVPGPAMPGGFDFGRQLYFAGVGGLGRISGEVKVVGENDSASLTLARLVTAVRDGINMRIAATLPQEEATVAQALITGERAQIPRETNTSLQVSGLAHILSISGLHMSLAAGGMFWLVRALLALSPVLALTYPIKKWAAGAALAGGFLYMLLAGSGAATQRSYIMVAIMLFAIMVDRSAISLRNLAVAAIIILLWQPESAIEASFQMSFMAVMGLASFFEWWNGRIKDPEVQQRSLISRWSRRFALAVAASLLTSLIAGSLSAIPAVFHFGRVAPYGVLANGLAIPVVSLVVMPMALLSVIAMPFGLEAWPLAVMGYGVSQVLAISDWVASLAGARHVLPQIPAASAMLLALGAAILCLARLGSKPWCVAFFVAGLVTARLTAFPDLLVERTGANVAVRTDGGVLAFALPRKAAFAAGRWLQANGEEATLQQASQGQTWSCESGICRTMLKGQRIVYLASETAVLPECGTIDILVSAVPLRRRCRNVALRIDRFDVWRHGAHAVQITPGKLSVITTAAVSGRRPWVVVPTPRQKELTRAKINQ